MAAEVRLNSLVLRRPAIVSGWCWSGLWRRRPLFSRPVIDSTAAPSHAFQPATSGSNLRCSLRLRHARGLLRSEAAAPARARTRLQGVRGRRPLPRAAGALRPLRHAVAALARCRCHGRDDVGHVHACRAAPLGGAAGRRGIAASAGPAAVQRNAPRGIVRKGRNPITADRDGRPAACQFTTGQGRRPVGALVALPPVVPGLAPVTDRLRG